MTPDHVLSLGRDATLLMLLIAGPILAVGLIVGLAVSVFQAVTQIQEMTLTFIPKLIAILGVLRPVRALHAHAARRLHRRPARQPRHLHAASHGRSCSAS